MVMTEIRVIKADDVESIKIEKYHDPVAGHGDTEFVLVKTSNNKWVYLDTTVAYMITRAVRNNKTTKILGVKPKHGKKEEE